MRGNQDWYFEMGSVVARVGVSLASDLVTPSPAQSQTWALNLKSLECTNAQERKDEPYIKVNGRRVWGPQTMRTGETRRIGIRLSVDPNDKLKIELWEKDRGKDELIGSETVTYTTKEIWGESAGYPSFRFHRDKGISGNATYKLHVSY